MVKLTFFHEVFKVPSLINPFPNLIKNSCLFVPVAVFSLAIFSEFCENKSIFTLLWRSEWFSKLVGKRRRRGGGLEGFSREVVLFARNQRGSALLPSSLHPYIQVCTKSGSSHSVRTKLSQQSSQSRASKSKSIKQRTWEKQYCIGINSNIDVWKWLTWCIGYIYCLMMEFKFVFSVALPSVSCRRIMID